MLSFFVGEILALLGTVAFKSLRILSELKFKGYPLWGTHISPYAACA